MKEDWQHQLKQRVAGTKVVAGVVLLGIAGTMLYLSTSGGHRTSVAENENYFTNFNKPLPEVTPVEEPQVADLPPLQESVEADVADLSHTPYVLPDIADVSIEEYQELPEILPTVDEVDLPPLES